LHLLLIAFYLTILTFYLGTLIYALPIPVTGLKRWGPRLLNDAFFIAILISSIEIILGFVDYLRQILGGDWSTYLGFVKGMIVFRSTAIMIMSALASTLSKIIPGIARIITIGINMVSASLYALMLLYFLGLVIFYGMASLVSLGVALMAVPFRISRAAGAFLVSFALVFYLALPLYPQFLLFIASPLPRSALDVSIVYGNVYCSPGCFLDGGFVGIKVGNDYIGPVKLGTGGRMTLLMPRKYMTSNAYIYFDVTGHRFYTNMSNIALADICQTQPLEYMCRVDIRVDYILFYSNGLTIHTYPPTVSVTNINVSQGSITISLSAAEDTHIYISAVKSYDFVKVSIDDTLVESLEANKSYEWVWYNIPGRTYSLKMSRGKHVLTIDYVLLSSEGLEPSVEDLYPTTLFRQDIDAGEFLDYLASTIYLELISSILYLSIMLSATYGLTRLLGGTSRLRLIP